ncbi:SDR family NAD(P)-dependent oxidoreductase [Nocardiopsis dassonvillei]|uniref:SDR family NAD(P)-dependent oxidoreductase n=1 Tax=Nocardiopsis dassonvillei TaxID=2014 RepID=UPI0033F54398
MSERLAILTGGATGIGAAILRRLRMMNYKTLVIGLSPPAPDQVVFARHDLTAQEEIEGAVQDVRAFLSEHGRPADILINNAGGGMPCRAESLSAEVLANDISLNLVAPMLLSAAVLPGMKLAGRGVIVNVASTAGRTGVAYLHGYAAAKAGLLAFTQSLAIECAPDGIRVNAVCPGAVESEMAAKGRAELSQLRGLAPEIYERGMANATGLGRLLTPNEVAEVVCWVAEGSERPMTGQAINVCGTIEMS